MANDETMMPDKQALQHQEEKLEKKNKWMYPVLITVLTLVFAVGFIYGIQLVLNLEGTFPPAALTESKTKAPETNAELIAYINAIIEKTEEEKPALSSEWKFRINDDSIETSGSDTLKKTLVFLADPAEDEISDGIDKNSTTYGEDLDGILRIPEITESDIERFTCDYIYYRCPSNGEQSDVPMDSCPVCGYGEPYEMRYRDNYSITVELKNTPELAEKLFAPSSDEVEEIFTPYLGEFAQLTEYSAENTKLCILLTVQRATDELKQLTYRKELSAEGSLSFTGEYVSLGQESCSADFYDETVFSFTWPAVELNKHTLTLAPGKKEQITAERICDDPKAYEITWTSSDESIVTVDKNGYVKAGKNTGTAVVTASFDFNGKTYSDSCEVKVKISVEYIEVNKHHLTLSVGGSETLKARVASDNKGFALKKPTIQTVSWYSSDEDVATVDENGCVKAVSPGKAIIYVYSDDEYYRASCEVTVND